MHPGGFKRRALYALCVCLAGPVPSVSALESQRQHSPLSSTPTTVLGSVQGGLLLEVFKGARSALPSPQTGAFDPLPEPGRNAPILVGAEAVEPVRPDDPRTPPEPYPTRTASPPPALAPTALANSVARLIVGNSRNPLGAGDWAAARAAIGAFYAARGFEPVWVDENGLTRPGRAALGQIGRADQDGLNLSGLAIPKDVAAGLAPDDLAEDEVRIAVAVVAYAEQASGSRIAPSRIASMVASAPSVADPGLALSETASAPDAGARLAAFNPPQAGYRELRQQLRRLSDSAFRPDRQVALDLDGDPNRMPVVASDVIILDPDPEIDTPRARPRTRRSRAGRASADGLAESAFARRRADILANMEMWRWEPRDMGSRRIEVNIPDFSVAVLDGDRVIHSARVVVGKPKTPTPIFSGVMRYVLINPEWRVPESIVRKEILPRLEHFEQLGYEVKTVGGRVTVRQPPGETNALGRLAFMFPNDHSVYLHDTPARELFSEDMRARSHGCIRVEDPMRLAELVLGWPESRISAAIGGREQTVFLKRPLPIHIEYFTDFVDEDGILQERPDVYGLTGKVAHTLSLSRQD